MGGRKKLTLKQMEKMQRRLAEKRAGRESRRGSRSSSQSGDKGLAGIIPPNIMDEKVISEIKRMRVITPYTIASRFNIRLSIAKDFLEDLHRRGIIDYVSGGRNIRIYKPAD